MFELWLVEYVGAEPMNAESRLHLDKLQSSTCVGNSSVLPSCVFLPCEPSLLLTQNTSLLVTKGVEVSPDTKQLSVTPAGCSTL